ncbi:hypothetical protein ACZ87_03915 [Candidatus Erwinia dacicola]|uniref:Uncharacterized protein n=1 Tax=Candidatus Erwinia dacicola TaxID=252393 RepID=A0A328TET4_9GAMM|nr:hypothetical protein ACZ87_03915 [Candidatus Erwinia dacicola]
MLIQIKPSGPVICLLSAEWQRFDHIVLSGLIYPMAFG